MAQVRSHQCLGIRTERLRFHKKGLDNILFGLLGKLWLCIDGTGFNEEEENHSV